jgi:iron complex outermembrane receptor protein
MHRRSINPRVMCAIAAALTVSTTGIGESQAQSEDGFGLEEIVVTARKVEENVMTVPLSITAFSEREIEAAGMKDLGDVMRMTPSFNFVNQFGSSGRNDRSTNSLVFRGLYLNSNAGLNAGGLMFIDGAPVIGAQPPPITDVARIEVLKGPQSAYFGRSAFAGAINFVTRDPNQEFGGRAAVEYSSWDSFDANLSVEGGLTEDLAARVSLRSYKRGGQYTNFTDPNGQKLGEQTSESISLSMAWTPSDKLKIKGYFNAFRNDDGPPAQLALKSESFNGRANPDGTCTPFSQVAPGTPIPGNAASNTRPTYGYYCGTLPKMSQISPSLISGDWDTSSSLTQRALFDPASLSPLGDIANNWLIFDPTFKSDGGTKREAVQGDLRIDYDFDNGMTLSALTAIHRDKSATMIDLNYRSSVGQPNRLGFLPNTPSYPQMLLMSQTRLRDISQEIRLTSNQQQNLRWTIGANYFDGEIPGSTVYGFAPTGVGFFAAVTQQTATTPALFGGVYYDLSDRLTLGVEGRYQKDKIEQTPKVGTNGRPVVGGTSLSNTFNSFSPRVSLDYQLNDDTILYGLFSRGFRPGGFNAGLVVSSAATIAALRSAVPSAGVVYDEEQLDNFEVGIKSTFLDGRARAIFTVFKNDWKDGQVANVIPIVVNDTLNLINVVINNGQAELKGIEFEGQYQVNRNLKLAATLGYIESELTSYGEGTGSCTDCNFIYGSFEGAIGNSLPTVPELTYTLTAELGDSFGNGLEWFGRFDFMHQGEKYTDFSNVAKVGDKQTANARFGIRSDKWSIEAFGNNIFDNDVLEAGLLGVDALTFFYSFARLSPQKNEVRASPPLPRAFGIRASYNF